MVEFPIPTAGAKPEAIVAGPDGNLWFAEESGNKIGVIAPDGVVIHEYPLVTPGSTPGSTIVGPDGRIWFTEFSAGKIGAIDTDGRIGETSLGSSVYPEDLDQRSRRLRLVCGTRRPSDRGLRSE